MPDKPKVKRVGDTVRFRLQSAHPELNGLEGKGMITGDASDGPDGPMVSIRSENGNMVNIYVPEIIDGKAE
ncbi:MAG: hypothetical protein ACOC6S_03340 [Chloroflexota bacterium]